eukprot:jgi/Chlat1/6808/Chrsp51S06499
MAFMVVRGSLSRLVSASARVSSTSSPSSLSAVCSYAKETEAEGLAAAGSAQQQPGQGANAVRQDEDVPKEETAKAQEKMTKAASATKTAGSADSEGDKDERRGSASGAAEGYAR